MWTLPRSRAKLRQTELIKLAAVVDGRLRPRAQDDLQRLRRALAAVVAAKPVPDELVLVEVRPVPDADVDAPVREVVEQRQLGGEPDRMAQRQLDHGKADADARRARRHGAGEWNRIAVDAFAGEVVLGEPHAVEARRLREAGLRHQLVDGGVVRVTGRRMRERQPAEAHRPIRARAPARAGSPPTAPDRGRRTSWHRSVRAACGAWPANRA